MLYQACQTQSDPMAPFRMLAQAGASLFWLGRTEGSPLRALASTMDVFSRLKLTHARPDYGIDPVQVGDTPVAITERNVLELPFGKDPSADVPWQPSVLLVAPLSGHFATLLRETARTLLQDHDVYITDWHNARDVKLRAGQFALDDYIDYMVRCRESIGPGAHVVSVCQPCVAALAATAVMAEDDNPAQPCSLTLMASPVDCRVNPTGVNTMATSKPIGWFERNLISHVPLPHAGFMRRVYPGVVQLGAFMSMNPERHKNAFRDMYRHLVDGDVEKGNVIRIFYDEYLAVNDLPAEFYLETVEKVFQTYDLAHGARSYRGRTVDPSAIRRNALMKVEGERDDICSVGLSVADIPLRPRATPGDWQSSRP